MKKSIFVLISIILFTTLFMPAITANAAQMKPELILTADKTVQKGSQFELTVKFEGTREDIYAQDLSIKYNAEKFSYCSIETLDKKMIILICDTEKAGTLRIISAGMNAALVPGASLYKLTFNVKDVKPGAKEQFKLSDIKLGTAPEGTIIQADGNTITINCASDKTTVVQKIH